MGAGLATGTADLIGPRQREARGPMQSVTRAALFDQHGEIEYGASSQTAASCGTLLA
jgi:hypothetical protein